MLVLPAATGCADDTRPPLTPFAPDDAQIVRFARHALHHPYAPARLEGFAALAHVEASAVEATADLAELTESDSPFERRLALWTLMRIGTPESRAIVDARIGDEPMRLDEGSTWNLAGDVALVVGRRHGETAQGLVDAALPQLYNAARGERLDEKLVAAWALYEIGAPVTEETADAAVGDVAAGLGPGVRDLSRLLYLLRLIGPRDVPALQSALEEMLAAGEDGAGEISLVPRRAQVARTLAKLSHPVEPESVRTFKESMRDRLFRALDRSRALEEAMALGPWACAPELLGDFESLAEEGSLDDEEQETTAKLLALCAGD